MIAHACDWQRMLVWRQHGLHGHFKDSLVYNSRILFQKHAATKERDLTEFYSLTEISGESF